MKNVLAWALCSGLMATLFACAQDAARADTAKEEARRWIAAHLEGRKDAVPPFSFTYDGRPSQDLLPTWRVQRATRKLDGARTEHTLTFTDPKTGLLVRCVAVQYHDFPTVEWTLYFKNTGRSDTPILADIQALDARFQRRGAGEFTLHHHTGSLATPKDFEPHATPLPPKADQRIATTGGRPSNSVLPYMNLEKPGGGVIIVVGWPGQWAARFERDAGAGLRVRAGQELTHFKLHPGEEVRSPLMVLQFWTGDRIEAQNVWRRWMVAHNLPRPGGKLPPTQLVACSSHQFGEMIHANEENQKLFVDRYLAEGLKIDYWWMDAGWYINDGTWVNTGTWEVDPKRFPRGLRAITDHAHAKGVRSIVWFEPERVTPGTWLYEQHPEWLLNPPPNPGNQAYQKDWKLLNLGNPEARQWLTDHVDRILTEQGIDLYRQDFNIDPLYYWRANDAEDRQGITEIRYVEGYLAYWDELRRRHPNMLIDSCASGGRRNDLETLRRAVPLIRSDYLFEPVSQQCHAYSLSFWIPFHGTGTLVGPSKIFDIPTGQVDPYVFRSNMACSVTACWDVRRTDLDYAALRRLVGELRRVSPYYLTDYYPLTPYSLEKDVWMAWQYNRPEQGDGVVQAFRRAEAAAEAMTFRLQGLEAEARYRLTELDTNRTQERSGRELMRQGLKVAVPTKPGAAILVYERISQ